LYISKKELLSTTGISYGQLYRWKREKLIPEEWFVKQSSYTGQETFFPKDKISNRIEFIMNMKDEHSFEVYIWNNNYFGFIYENKMKVLIDNRFKLKSIYNFENIVDEIQCKYSKKLNLVLGEKNYD